MSLRARVQSIDICRVRRVSILEMVIGDVGIVNALEFGLSPAGNRSRRLERSAFLLQELGSRKVLSTYIALRAQNKNGRSPLRPSIHYLKARGTLQLPVTALQTLPIAAVSCGHRPVWGSIGRAISAVLRACYVQQASK